MDRIFSKAEHVFKDHILENVKDALGQDDQSRPQQECHSDNIAVQSVDTSHRFSSFSPQTTGKAKWYVDGASYFYAVSMALEGSARVPPRRDKKHTG
jgi:phospholipase D1/2